MAKAPVAGRVKTRLGREIGMTEAAWWYRHQCRRLFRRLADPRWDLILALAPDSALRRPTPHPRMAQGPGHLGRRMMRIFRHLPPGPALIVGTDIPLLGARHIARAFRLLGGAEVVIGPAPDGGYWLIGMNRTRRPRLDLLDRVRWSTRYAQIDTMIALRDRRIVLADRLGDIDTAADLAAHKRMVKTRAAW